MYKRQVYYGLGETCSVRGKDIVYDGESTCYTCVYLDKEYPVKFTLLGIHNVYDSLAAAAAGLSLGVDMDHIDVYKRQTCTRRFRIIWKASMEPC